MPQELDWLVWPKSNTWHAEMVPAQGFVAPVQYVLPIERMEARKVDAPDRHEPWMNEPFAKERARHARLPSE